MSEKSEDVDAQIIIKNEKQNNKPTCKINFENSQNHVYYAGQVVTGCVNLSIKKPTTVRAIYTNIVGRGYCKWQTSSGTSRRREHTTYKNEEFYINRKIYNVGSQNTSAHVVVQPGKYKYLFNCEIPDECHTSVEEFTGFIRYSVILVIEKDENVKKEFVESFTVINELNLNNDEIYSYPMSDETELIYTKYCCWLCCCLNEPVKVSVKVPMKGYAPGQAIEITINIDNKSNRTYDNIVGNIIKKIEYYADGKMKVTKDGITTAKCKGCLAGQSIARKLIITVPPTPRTETSNICSISYELTIEADADWCESDPKFEFPITVGTYPVERTNTQTNGIVVTQLPSTGILNQNEVNEFPLRTNILNEPSQSQPLLFNENSSEQCSSSGTTGKRTIDKTTFLVAEFKPSDKRLRNSYKPLYPVYGSDQIPLTCNLKIEAVEVKPMEM